MILHRVEADKWGESCLEVETMEDSKVRSRIREQRELVSKKSIVFSFEQYFAQEGRSY